MSDMVEIILGSFIGSSMALTILSFVIYHF